MAQQRSQGGALWFWGGAGALILYFVFFAHRAPAPTTRDGTPLDPGRDPDQGASTLAAPLHWSRQGYAITLTSLASYRLCGTVVHREDYSGDWNALVSPCDVAMAWGPLLQGDLYKRLSWSQSDRWYYWQYGSDFGHDNSFIARHSSNTHLIPADETLAQAARSLNTGDVAELMGDLVRVDAKRGDDTRWWISSTSRDDTGDGSCEVLYLKRLRIGDRVYE